MNNDTLQQQIINSEQHTTLGRYVLLFLTGLVALAASSNVYIPLFPVPITLESFVVVFIGMTYGSRFAVLTVASFLSLAFIQVPGFAIALPTPTLGYLLSFIPAACVAGWLVQQGFARSSGSALLVSMLAFAIIYSGGLLWLTTFMSLSTAIQVGFLPFIPGACLKLVALALLVPRFLTNK